MDRIPVNPVCTAANEPTAAAFCRSVHVRSPDRSSLDRVKVEVCHASEGAISRGCRTYPKTKPQDAREQQILQGLKRPQLNYVAYLWKNTWSDKKKKKLLIPTADTTL